MSLANARKHWRFLAVVLLIFLAAAASGPLIFYGLGPALQMIFDRFGEHAAPVIAVIFAALTLGWLFFVLWAGHRADRLGRDPESDQGAQADD